MARLLSPEDFGLVALALVSIAVLQVFVDFGLSSAIIHFQEVTSRQLATLYWLNVGVATILMTAVWSLSGPISLSIFREAQLQSVLQMSGPLLVIAALGQQLRVLNEKQLNFKLLAMVELGGALVGLVVAMVWALAAPSAYAIVGGLLANQLAQTSGLLLLSPPEWRPRAYFKINEVVELVRFGIYMVGSNLLQTVNAQVDVILGGRAFSSATLGLYTIPRNIGLTVARVVNPIITRVGFPVMAAAQSDRERLKNIYLKTMRFTASVNFPLYLGLAFFSEPVVMVLFGERWIESAPLLFWLAIWGLMRSVGNPVGSLILAAGRADLAMWWNAGLLLLIVPVLYTGTRWGVEGLAMMQALLFLFLRIPNWYFLVRPVCGATAADYFKSIGVAIVPSLVACGLAAWASSGVKNPLLEVSFALLIAIPSYLACSYVMNRQFLVELHELVLGAKVAR